MIKLLIVDDSALMRRHLVQLFEKEQDFRTLAVRNGQEALQALDEFDPDVITLDINMPVMDGLPCLARRAEDIYGSRDMGREIKAQYAVIDRLAQEMQRAIMDVRMLPVSEVFERFPRLVRDLARKLNKHIELKIVGEDTAADKTIIESLGDPLIHLVRNAIDHGIESPEQRVAAGKPAAAMIQLKAFQERDQVVIEVSDDGKDRFATFPDKRICWRSMARSRRREPARLARASPWWPSKSSSWHEHRTRRPWTSRAGSPTCGI